MITWRAIVRGAATRFAGGIAAFFTGSFVLAAVLKGVTIGPSQAVGFAELMLSLTAGYVIALGMLRPSLRSEAGVVGRRSVLAGLAATCVYLYMGTLHAGPTPHLLRDVFALAAGGLTTLCVFFPWLSNHLDRQEIDARELQAADFDRVAASYPTAMPTVANPHIERVR
jgi:hypothetical protein